MELKDFLDSATAKRFRIDNYPSFLVVDSLRELSLNILDPLVEATKRQIIIARGFLCERINLIEGIADTLHTKGYAVDIVPLDGNLTSLISDTQRWLKDNDIAFDEVKEEMDVNGRHFFHIALYGENKEQRKIFG